MKNSPKMKMSPNRKYRRFRGTLAERYAEEEVRASSAIGKRVVNLARGAVAGFE